MKKKFVVRSQPWFLKQAVELSTPSDNAVTFRHIKVSAMTMFGMRKDSMPIFGLFELQPDCLPMIPLKLHIDWEIATEEEYLNLGLMRLCFDREAEDALMDNDILSIDKIYLESKSAYEVGAMVGSPKDIADATNERLSKYTVKRRKLREHIPKLVQHLFVPPEEEKYFRKLRNSNVKEYTIEDYLMFAANVKKYGTVCKRIMYMQTIHSLNQSYWCYFHKVVGCILCGDFAKIMAPYMNLNDKFEIVVALNRTCLSILGVTAANQFLHLVDFPWISIHSVVMNSAEKTFSFQVLHEDRKKHHANLVTISIRTDYFEYLYTMALFLLQLQKNVLFAVNFKSPHILTKEELGAIKSLKPSSIDCDNFLCMVLPPDFLLYLGEKMPAKLDVFQPLEISALPKAGDVVSPEVMHINTAFRPVAFRLKQVRVTPQQMEAEKEPGYLKVIQGKNVSTIPFYRSETVAKFSSCSKISPPPNTFSRLVTVHTFMGIYRIPIYRCSMTVEDFIGDISKVLCLTSIIKNIFMLYSFKKRGSLLLSTRAYLRHHLLPNDSQFIYRRSGLYSESEVMAWIADFVALDMLYLEAKHTFENDLVLPKITDDKVIAQLKQWISDIEEKKLPNVQQEEMTKTEFLGKMYHASSYWWLHYHRIDDIQIPNMALFEPLRTQLKVTTITLSYKGLCLLNAAGTIQIMVPTEKILAVLQDQDQSHTITFEILQVVTSKGGERETVIIPLVCISRLARNYILPIMICIIASFNSINEKKDTTRWPRNKYVNFYFGPTVESHGFQGLQCINFYTSVH